MKRKMLLSIIVLILISICSYFTYGHILKQNAPNPEEYISFTIYYPVFYHEDNDYLDHGGAVYEYNLQSKKISEIFKFPDNTQYTLGVYDKKSNSVFYTKELNNDTYNRYRTGDQIYVHDLSTGSDKALTDDLLAVNFIEPVDGAIFFIAARQVSPSSLSLGKIDLSGGNVTYWNEPVSASTRMISVDKVKKRVYVALYDSDEEYVAMSAGDTPPNYTICSYDYNLSDKREILHKDNLEVKALYVRDNQLIYRVDNTICPLPDTVSTVEMIDLNSMNTLFQSEDIFLTQCGNLSKDNKGFYSMNAVEDFEGICYYDFSTKEYTPLVQSHIANFQLMY